MLFIIVSERNFLKVKNCLNSAGIGPFLHFNGHFSSSVVVDSYGMRLAP